MSTSALPERVLLLARSEDSVRMDAASLRRIGITSIALLSGKDKAIAALLELEKRKHAISGAIAPDIILCDEFLADASALEFFRDLALHPSLRRIPVLGLAGSHAAATALRTAGVAALERPYAQQDLHNQLVAAMNPERPGLDPALFSAPVAPATPASPPKKEHSQETLMTSDWCKLGVQRLQTKDIEGAEKAFQNALVRQDDNIDACLGLACIHQRRENIPMMNKYLLRASAAATRQNDHLRAQAIREKLPAPYGRGNIFMHEGVQFMQDGTYKAAALAFLDAARLEPERPLHRILARACQLTGNPELNLREMCDAFERLGQYATARGLRQRLLSEESLAVPSTSPSWLDNFPLVRDVIAVASFTASVWRQAG